jgi:two-component system, NtrC family, sensor kinase
MMTERDKQIGQVSTLPLDEEINLIDGLNEQVWKNTWKGNWPHLFTQALDARDRAERVQYQKGLAHAHLNLGQLYRLHSEPDKAEPSFIEARKLFKELGEKTGLGSTWHQLGLLYMHRGQYERSIEATLEAREIWFKLGDEERVATSYTAIGNLYSLLEQFDSAVEQYETALEIYRRNGDERGYARVLSNFARVYAGREEYQKSIELQLEAIEKLQALDQPINVASVYLNLGSTYAKLGQYDQSIAVLSTALETADQNQYRRAQFVGRLYLAETYIMLKDFETARRYLDEANEFAWYADLGDVLPFRRSIEAQVFAGEGNFKRAYELECEAVLEKKKNSNAQVQQAVATKAAHMKFDRLRLEQEALAAKNDELQRLNEQKDQLLRIVSHDMRNPLGFIIGMGNLLKTEPEDNIEAVQQIGGLIEDTGQRLLVLVNNLLNAARLEEGSIKLEKQSTSIAALLDETAKLFGPLAKNKSIALNLDASQVAGQVNIDEPKLQQVVSNIVSNAVKFTPNGGKIEVKATRNDGALNISVRDNGIGLNSDQMNELFTKYSHSRRSGTNGEQGIGLGMTIIKQFVELHGGSVSVTSAEGQGTNVTISLPDL